MNQLEFKLKIQVNDDSLVKKRSKYKYTCIKDTRPLRKGANGGEMQWLKYKEAAAKKKNSLALLGSSQEVLLKRE